MARDTITQLLQKANNKAYPLENLMMLQELPLENNKNQTISILPDTGNLDN